MITEYEDYCILCNRPRTDIHHCVFGVGRRNLAEADGLTMPLCASCHRAIHQGKMQTLSKIIGQLLYERNKCAEGMTTEEARLSFQRRYFESYL